MLGVKDGSGLLMAIKSKTPYCKNIFFWHEPKGAKNLVLLLDGRALLKVYRIWGFSLCIRFSGEKIEEAFNTFGKAFFAF